MEVIDKVKGGIRPASRKEMIRLLADMGCSVFC